MAELRRSPSSMSRRPKYSEEDFPAPGTIFVAPTQDGRLSCGLVHDLRTAPKLTPGLARRLLKRSVEGFNRLDAAHQFINTLEREEICEAYEEIMCAARFPQLVNAVDQWRDW